MAKFTRKPLSPLDEMVEQNRVLAEQIERDGVVREVLDKVARLERSGLLQRASEAGGLISSATQRAMEAASTPGR